MADVPNKVIKLTARVNTEDFIHKVPSKKALLIHSIRLSNAYIISKKLFFPLENRLDNPRIDANRMSVITTNIYGNYPKDEVYYSQVNKSLLTA